MHIDLSNYPALALTVYILVVVETSIVFAVFYWMGRCLQKWPTYIKHGPPGIPIFLRNLYKVLLMVLLIQIPLTALVCVGCALLHFGPLTSSSAVLIVTILGLTVYVIKSD